MDKGQHIPYEAEFTNVRKMAYYIICATFLDSYTSSALILRLRDDATLINGLFLTPLRKYDFTYSIVEYGGACFCLYVVQLYNSVALLFVQH
jgi:hypothetical protein